jgi:hypothetical protein
VTRTIPRLARLEDLGGTEDLQQALGHDSDLLAEAERLVEAVLIFSRHHYLRFDGRDCERKDFRDETVECFGRDPANWSASQAELILCLLALSTAGVGLEQLDRELSIRTTAEVLEARFRMYCSALGHPRPNWDQRLLMLATRVSSMRADVERFYHRYSLIDGRLWYRDEGLIPRRALDTDTFSDEVDELLARHDPAADRTADTRTRLTSATRAVIAQKGTPEELVRGFLRAVVGDATLRVHHATLTCVRGRLLECPHALSATDDFYTHTEMADGLDLTVYAQRLGHDSMERLTATLRARMIKLKRKAVTNFYGDGPFAGQWIEKAADNMIFFNEDAHYRGHQTVGVATGGRSAFDVSFDRNGASTTLPPMMGDLRVVRMGADESDRFQQADLEKVIVYAGWLRLIVQETFRAGALIGPVRRGEVSE